MIPVAAVAALYSLAGKGLTEHAEKRVWTGALTRRFRAGRTTIDYYSLATTSPKECRVKRIHAGMLERHNPLPPGRYWIDIFESGQQAWVFWTMYANVNLKILKMEHYEGDVSAGYESRDWILFETTAPLTWDTELAKKIGWPNIAGKNVNTSDDTVQKPEAEGLFPKDWTPGLKLAVGGGAILAVAVLVGYSVRSFR